MAEPWYQRLEVIIALAAVGFITVVCLLLIIIRLIWMRRQKRYNYGITEDEEEMNLLKKQNELQEQTQIGEQDLLKARMFLRSTDFALTKPIHNMGRTYKKHMMVRKPSGQYYVYSIMEARDPIPIVSSENEKYIFLSLLKQLDHPYIMKTDIADYSVAEQQIITIRALAKRGSLRDVIDGSNPLDSYDRKYNGTKIRNISDDQLVLFVNQIIMALASLKLIGIMFKNLSSRNVLIDSEGDFSVARLTDIEDTFLRVVPPYDTRTYSTRVNQDTVALFHMLKTLPQVPELDRIVQRIEREDVTAEELSLMIGGSTLNPIPRMDKKTATFISKLRMTVAERRLQKRQSVAIMSKSSSMLMPSKSTSSSAASSYVNANFNNSVPSSVASSVTSVPSSIPNAPPPPPPPSIAPVASMPAPQPGRGDFLAEIRRGTKLTFKG